jgi:REP element-mobilizing transposase RayT
MAQSLAKIWLHIIFSTKERLPFLKNPEIRDEMFRYLAGTCQEWGSSPVQIGGVSDHVHILSTLPKTTAASEFVKNLKQASSRWIKRKGGILARISRKIATVAADLAAPRAGS